MAFWDTFWATMWGALAGAIVASTAAWLYALDLQRRDTNDRNREREERYRKEVGAQWARLSSDLEEYAAAVDTDIFRELAAMRAVTFTISEIGTTARAADAVLLHLTMGAVTFDPPGNLNRSPRLYRSSTIIMAVATKGMSVDTGIREMLALQALKEVPDLTPLWDSPSRPEDADPTPS